MKVIIRVGQVKYVSVAFESRAASLSDVFRERLDASLSISGRSRFRVITSERDSLSWFVVFDGSWLERELDEILIMLANELGLQMYIDPGMPESEITLDRDGFSASIDPTKRRPSN